MHRPYNYNMDWNCTKWWIDIFFNPPLSKTMKENLFHYIQMQWISALLLLWSWFKVDFQLKALKVSLLEKFFGLLNIIKNLSSSIIKNYTCIELMCVNSWANKTNEWIRIHIRTLNLCQSVLLFWPYHFTVNRSRSTEKNS